MENKIKIVDVFQFKDKNIIVEAQIVSGKIFIGSIFRNIDNSLIIKIKGVGMNNILEKTTYSLSIDVLKNVSNNHLKLRGLEFFQTDN